MSVIDFQITAPFFANIILKGCSETCGDKKSLVRFNMVHCLLQADRGILGSMKIDRNGVEAQSKTALNGVRICEKNSKSNPNS